ncbi:hypothetical protein KXV68_004102 [Aspergillus fumigatus]|uniref:Uncharacterized protein n=2 Tax=Aspergillus fumigatus TaxID=746128 RepID=Q4X0F4_ASPFU|nr:conserved hypothetical protein [Aspergillus fumigatus Af293]KAF4269935.1 hypothetical protein CNMCM8714_006379 [Aspergillus fumigatus]KMK61665.1 hypothetical protein Y699_02506 [Aspergillus fumigatus Z5]EAL93661.1 conserved hypothetical protein [Aspergillus fumigatus Af293]KAF4275716.1 hypothetical protein CNMCM8812_000247 [Aspergillus fumigatus]KAH1306612.1 hypothetical protein KXX11_006958 [Aspergillus fumigatus]
MALSIAKDFIRLETPLSPQSPEQWKQAIQEVKLLYLQRQYKQCAARSFEILEAVRGPIHPVYKTCLYFYSAISYEEMGRAAHNYSRRKLPLLHSALDSFVTCSAILPSTIPVPDNNSESSSPASLVESWTASDFSESPSPVGALVSSITDIIDKSMLCPDDDPFISDSEGWVELALDIPENLPPRMPQDDQRLMPSPLRLRNSSVDLHKTGRQNQPARLCPPPPPLPIKILPADAMEKNPELSGPDRTPRAQGGGNIHADEHKQTPMTPARAESIRRYNSTLESLRVQFSSSIADIHALVDEIRELQSARQASKNFRRSASFWSFSPIKEGPEGREKLGSSGRVIVKETKEQRIARLRAEGWKTVGMRSPVRGWKGAAYYQAYCNSVLDELYLEV